MSQKKLGFRRSWICLLLALSSLQVFAQGSLVEHPAGSTPTRWGFVKYLPSDYNSNGSEKYPLIIHLSGVGEAGNGSSDLHKVTNNGPLNLVKTGKWPVRNQNNQLPSDDFIIVNPQSSGGFFNSRFVNELIDYAIDNYNADPNRVYIMGLSAGAFSTWRFLADYPDVAAAAIPIAGNGARTTNLACGYKNVPIWAFHGGNDGTVGINGSILPVNAVNNCSPAPSIPAKLTVYPNVGHNSWSRTYSLSGMGQGSSDWDPFNMSIYDWLLQYSKNGSTSTPPPSANAGSDITIELPINSTNLNGSGSVQGGSITSYLWSKVSGPSQYQLSNKNSANTTVSNLAEGVYQFRLKVTDNQGRTATDNVSINVLNNGNQSPIVELGSPVSVNLPDNTVTITADVSDPDGQVSSYNWEQSQGPAQATIDENDHILEVSSLQEGTYRFSLTIMDNDGAQASDAVDVIVTSSDPSPSSGDFYIVEIVSNKKVLQSNLTIGTNNGSETQVWEKIDTDNGWFRLKSKSNGKSLISNSNYTASLVSNSTSANSEWKLVSTRGGYRLQNKQHNTWLRGFTDNSVVVASQSLTGSWTKWNLKESEVNNSIAENNESENKALFNLYPNPATSTINLKVPNSYENPSYVIYSMMGEVVKEGVLESNNLEDTQIGIDELESKTYVFKLVDSKTGEYIQKVWMKK